jgi:putative tryptophan/tyrosine transport system substrate-binding protein
LRRREFIATLGAAELVGLPPDAILASNTPAVAALRQQTRTIPIVFVRVSDPVGQGFVESLARPGGNITGFSVYDAPLMGKWVQLLKEVAPCVTRVAVIFNPDTAPYAALLNRGIEAAARLSGLRRHLFRCTTIPGSRTPSPPMRASREVA